MLAIYFHLFTGRRAIHWKRPSLRNVSFYTFHKTVSVQKELCVRKLHGAESPNAKPFDAQKSDAHPPVVQPPPSDALVNRL